MNGSNAKKYVVLSLVAALIYGVAWWSLAYPYRVIPTDDQAFLGVSGDIYGSYIETAINEGDYIPVFWCSLRFLKYMFSVFSENFLSSLLLLVIFSNSLALFILSLLIFRLTRSTLAVLAGIVLYGTSAWPANYCFWGSYVPLYTMWRLLTLLLIIEALFNRESRNRLFLFAGFTSAFSVLSAPFAGLDVFLEILIIFYLFSSVPLGTRFKLLGLYLLPQVIAGSASLLTTRFALIYEVCTNINRPHNAFAIEMFGYLPKAPFFSFFHIGFAYTPVIVTVFIVGSISFLIFFVIKKRKEPLDRIIVSLSLAVYARAIIADSTVFHQYARGHFSYYPLLVILAVIIPYHFFASLPGALKKLRPYLLLVALELLLVAIYTNTEFCHEMVRSNHFPGNYLSRLASDTELYILENDPHAYPISRWSGLDITRINNLRDIPRKKGKKTALIIGPHGVDSRKSIVRDGIMKDFFPAVVKPPEAREIKLPYLAYFPSFLFEETVSQALYFSGDMPDYRDEDKQITLWLWED